MEFSEYILHILETRGTPETTFSVMEDLSVSVGDVQVSIALRNTEKRRKWKLGSETALRSGKKGPRILMDD